MRNFFDILMPYIYFILFRIESICNDAWISLRFMQFALSFIGFIFIMFGDFGSDIYMYFFVGKFWRLSFWKAILSFKVFEQLYWKGDVFNVVLCM